VGVFFLNTVYYLKYVYLSNSCICQSLTVSLVQIHRHW